MLHLVSDYEDAVPVSERAGHKSKALDLFYDWLDNNKP